MASYGTPDHPSAAQPRGHIGAAHRGFERHAARGRRENPTLSDFRVLVAPGLHDSRLDHWQTRWERLHPAFERIEQWDWDRPDLDAWSAQVGHMLRRSARPAILVAHSFGCLATVHRAAAGAPNLAGALLVAPADPHKFGIERELMVAPLAVPTIVVGSENDPWLSLERARTWARQWGSTFVNAGPLGHINADSNLADWPFGLTLLEQLTRLVQVPPHCRCGVRDAVQVPPHCRCGVRDAVQVGR